MMNIPTCSATIHSTCAHHTASTISSWFTTRAYLQASLSATPLPQTLQQWLQTPASAPAIKLLQDLDDGQVREQLLRDIYATAHTLRTELGKDQCIIIFAHSTQILNLNTSFWLAWKSTNVSTMLKNHEGQHPQYWSSEALLKSCELLDIAGKQLQFLLKLQDRQTSGEYSTNSTGRKHPYPYQMPNRQVVAPLFTRSRQPRLQSIFRGWVSVSLVFKMCVACVPLWKCNFRFALNPAHNSSL